MATDDKRILVSVNRKGVSFPAEASSDPVVLEGVPPAAFFELLAGNGNIDSAIGSGRLRISGSRREARRFFEMFALRD